MNAANAYRNAFFTTPFHVQLAQLHRQAGVFTKQVVDCIASGDIQSARTHIEYIQDIITFLRSSLDMSLEAAEKADATYAYYYKIMVRWFIEPQSYQEDVEQVVEFWDSWATTWSKVGM